MKRFRALLRIDPAWDLTRWSTGAAVVAGALFAFSRWTSWGAGDLAQASDSSREQWALIALVSYPLLWLLVAEATESSALRTRALPFEGTLPIHGRALVAVRLVTTWLYALLPPLAAVGAYAVAGGAPPSRAWFLAFSVAAACWMIATWLLGVQPALARLRGAIARRWLPLAALLVAYGVLAVAAVAGNWRIPGVMFGVCLTIGSVTVFRVPPALSFAESPRIANQPPRVEEVATRRSSFPSFGGSPWLARRATRAEKAATTEPSVRRFSETSRSRSRLACVRSVVHALVSKSRLVVAFLLGLFVFMVPQFSTMLSTIGMLAGILVLVSLSDAAWMRHLPVSNAQVAVYALTPFALALVICTPIAFGLVRSDFGSWHYAFRGMVAFGHGGLLVVIPAAASWKVVLGVGKRTFHLSLGMVLLLPFWAIMSIYSSRILPHSEVTMDALFTNLPDHPLLAISGFVAITFPLGIVFGRMLNRACLTLPTGLQRPLVAWSKQTHSEQS